MKLRYLDSVGDQIRDQVWDQANDHISGRS